jgi:hypothetical protein
MNISNIKKGMHIRISQSLKVSKQRWGLVSGMVEMTDTICTVENVDRTAAYVRNRDGRGYWFAPEDLTPVALTKKPSPVTFDPKNLEV